MPYHDCDLCKPLVERMVKPQVTDTRDSLSLSDSIDLGSLEQVLGASATCQFHNFILRIHDQVRPSCAIAPARGMPKCSASNTRISRIRAVLVTVPTPIDRSGRRQVWSNHVDFIESVDNADRPAASKWRAMFRLIADDIASVPEVDHYELGRLIDPLSACDPVFWKQSFGTCVRQHQTTCDNPIKSNVRSLLPDSMRVIDLVDQMITRLPPDSDYAVLSYVWGNTNFLRLTTANYATLSASGSLLDMQKPKTIYDAMIVAQSLGLRYLWIDALCIIQDDDRDKIEQVHRMGEIFTNAVLTIVGARSGHADGGLWSSEHRSQILGEGGGVRWLCAAPTLPAAVKLSAWSKRAWTYQEAAFSRRTLIFTEHQAYYSCKCSAWAEDYISRARDSHHQLEFLENQGHAPNTIERLTNYPSSWSYLLQQYTNRRLTFESDVLIASAGVVASYLRQHNDVALCGLPVGMLFEYSLLWKAVAPLTRRTRPNLNERYMFPSWSWAGWSGAVNYDATDDQYRQFVNAARVVRGWRFSCDDLKNDLSSSELHQKADHFLTDPGNHSSAQVSLQTVQQGTLIFSTLSTRLRIDRTHWNQFMESEDGLCEHTGYYKLYRDMEWIGSVHLEHSTARQLCGHQQEVIVLSTTGGRGATHVAPMPHLSGQTRDESWQPLCSRELLANGDDEMYNIMVVTKKMHHAKSRYRAGVGQVHKKSFDMSYRRTDVWLE